MFGFQCIVSALVAGACMGLLQRGCLKDVTHSAGKSAWQTTRLHGRKSRSSGTKTSGSSTKLQKGPTVITIEDPVSDLWKLEDGPQSPVEILNNGGVGVICTDTCYSFVTKLSSREGNQRLFKLKGTLDLKKPLTILCKDISTITRYTSSLSDEKWVFKLLKSTLPGPYTYILPSSGLVPKLVVEHNKHVKRFKRKEIGVRIPSDDTCSAILDSLDEPLLSGSVPETGEDIRHVVIPTFEQSGYDDADLDYMDDETEEDVEWDVIDDVHFMYSVWDMDWFPQVDFVIDAGPRGGSAADSLTTIVDLTHGSPRILREGKGTHDFSKQSL